MKRIILVTLCLMLLAACGHTSKARKTYHARDYQWHKQTMWIRVHWDYHRPDKDTIAADGFVEPFSPQYGVHDVRLELVGLDENGKVVNSAEGRPRDVYIAAPQDTSPFGITMKLKGGEKTFTVKGSYYHYVAGTQPGFDTGALDDISVETDEPY